MSYEAKSSIAGFLRPLLAGIGIAALWMATLLWAPPAHASHRLGSVISPAPQEIGPDSGDLPTGVNTWEVTISDPDPVTKYLILHFSNSTLSGNDRLEVDLGYDTDIFTWASGTDFWTRPVGGDMVVVRYIDDGVGAADGSVTFDKYGRGEEIDVFLLSSPFVDPAFACAGVCPPGDDPAWENVACLAAGTMKDTADSVGMIIFEKPGSHCLAGETTCLTSCSASLVDADRILTAGHCISEDARAASASFTLDFQTNCDSTAAGGYNPRFFKATRVVKTGYTRPAGDNRPAVDYSILQIDVSGGIGVPPVTIRTDAPGLGDELFVVHHPRGATKKVSHQPDDPTCSVNVAPSTVLLYSCTRTTVAPVHRSSTTWGVSSPSTTGPRATAATWRRTATRDRPRQPSFLIFSPSRRQPRT